MNSMAPGWRLPHLSPFALDLAIALALTVFIQADGLGVFSDASFQNPASNVPTALLMTVPLIWRRRFPLTVFAVALFGLVVTFTGDITAHPAIVWGAIVAIVVAAYSIGAYSRQAVASLAVLAATATLIVVFFGGGLPAPPDAAIPYILLILPWLVGQALRERQRRADVFQERAIRLEQQQALATQVALAEERARIARELHDVVAHSVSVMLVQAGAARQVLTAAPDEARQALLAVEAGGREAMSELRALLGVLSEDGKAADLAPQPGTDQLEALIHRVREAGLPVELRVDGTPCPLPVSLDLTAYRIVQEALTNALKYSGLAPTQVILSFRDGDLKVEVLDEGPGGPLPGERGQGRGLMGMRERVAMFGGRLEAGPRLERGYAVRAWLPLATSTE